MHLFSKFSVGLILAFIIFIPACRARVTTPDDLPKSVAMAQENKKETVAAQSRNNPVNNKIGFRTRRKFDEHYEKHGREFGGISQDEYLRQAQALRDAPVGGDILELSRGDGTVSRFDRSTGIFLAFDTDLTIRTCFKPNDGERYFKRQINKEH